MLAPKRRRPPERAAAGAIQIADKPIMFDSRPTIPQFGTVELIVRDRGRVLCLIQARAVRDSAGVRIAGFRIPAAVLP